MPSEIKRLLVIDGNALVHRAYHALPPLTTKKGELVNAVYGFLLVFLKALKDLRPGFVAATFDLKVPTFRHEAFEGYKAKRPKAPDELYVQLDKVKKVLRVLNVPIYEKEGFEADDIIGTIACQAPRKQAHPKIETIILSGDMDNLQLVNEQTKVYTLRKGIKDTVLYDVEKVKARYDGLAPGQLQDFRGLAGDASDNILGVTGIGQKTAIQLLKDFGSLEKIYQYIARGSKEISKIRPAVLKKLQDYQEQAFLSQQLAQIHCQVPIDFNLPDCRFGQFNLQSAIGVFQEFEFFSLLPKITEFSDSSQKVEENKSNSPNQSFNQASLLSSRVSGSNILKEIDELEKRDFLSPEIAQVERKLTPVVRKMEENGVKVDISRLKRLSVDLEKEIGNLQKKIYQIVGIKFNLNSPQQLSEILFSKLKISPSGLRKTPGGVISTGAEELKKLEGIHPAIGLILHYREVFKLKSGFADSLSLIINPKDGRIHPHFHQMGTETGRMSCSEPNLQNIPVRTELGMAVRECFVAEKGWQFISADYSQIELRIAASVAGDKKMIALFRAGEDIHIMTASEVFNLPKEKVDKPSRDLAKTLNFGVLYGMGYVSFARRTGLARSKAKEFIERYFIEFEGIAGYVKKAKAMAKSQGFAQTMFGRKRFLPEINSKDQRLRSQAERIAVNMPLQGAAADVIKMAMVELADQKIINQHCRLALQIHDELLFEVEESFVAKAVSAIKKIMETVVQLDVPLKTEIKIGYNWGQL